MSQYYKLPLTGEKIEEKLVNAISAPATASIGQTIVVKEVDENGKVIATEAVNMSSGGSAELDTTLTESGKAADAKAVGDKLADMQEDIEKATICGVEENVMTTVLENAQFVIDQGYFNEQYMVQYELTLDMQYIFVVNDVEYNVTPYNNIETGFNCANIPIGAESTITINWVGDSNTSLIMAEFSGTGGTDGQTFTVTIKTVRDVIHQIDQKFIPKRKNHEIVISPRARLSGTGDRDKIYVRETNENLTVETLQKWIDDGDHIFVDVGAILNNGTRELVVDTNGEAVNISRPLDFNSYSCIAWSKNVLDPLDITLVIVDFTFNIDDESGVYSVSKVKGNTISFDSSKMTSFTHNY